MPLEAFRGKIRFARYVVAYIGKIVPFKTLGLRELSSAINLTICRSTINVSASGRLVDCRHILSL